MSPEADGADPAHYWMRRAQADLAFARIPLPEGGLYEQLCFHAQQAVEKSLKALLVQARVDFPNTHNLQRLIDLLPPEIPADPDTRCGGETHRVCCIHALPERRGTGAGRRMPGGT